MIIVNADDWGRSAAETDAAAACHRAGRITSVSAMVFMRDSERAAALAKARGIDVGLHLNLTEPFDADVADARLVASQRRLCDFLGASRYALLLYHPGLRAEFRSVYAAQLAEFVRLYGAPPTHVDGHHHQHLCTNLLLEPQIARGAKVRRSFHFRTGDKSPLNRAYRRLTDACLARRYRTTDFFFSLAQCLRTQRLGEVRQLAETFSVELMTHPAQGAESDFLMSAECLALFDRLPMASYANL